MAPAPDVPGSPGAADTPAKHVAAAAALPDDAPHLLIVDDDRRIRTLLSRFLTSEGYRVTTAENVPDARTKLSGLSFDLLILDVMMPGESGFDLVKTIRTTSSVPILMLTARTEAEDRISGFEYGADDYVSKPFEPRELSLRVASILRRAQPVQAPVPEQICFGPFVFDHSRGELRRGDEVVHLTDREREMLRLLAATPNETVSRLTLAGGSNGVAAGERAVDVQINRLRRKLETDPADPLLIQTVRGIGYRLVVAT